jgi:hypothetical protein
MADNPIISEQKGLYNLEYTGISLWNITMVMTQIS